MPTIGPGQIERTGQHLAVYAVYMWHNCKDIVPGHYRQNDRDKGEERTHGDRAYQPNMAWLWQRYHKSANLHRLARFVLRCAASASDGPAYFGRWAIS
jgi:hypothetical protein